MKLVAISWVDAAIHGTDTFSRKEAENLGLITGLAVGIVVKETKEFITIAMDYFDEDDQFRTVQTYPKSGIYKIEKYEANPK